MDSHADRIVRARAKATEREHALGQLDPISLCPYALMPSPFLKWLGGGWNFSGPTEWRSITWMGQQYVSDTRDTMTKATWCGAAFMVSPNIRRVANTISYTKDSSCIYHYE